MDLHFILCRPGIPENIGAAARALAAMGFKHLRLVRPCKHLQLRSRSMACGALDLLEQAQVFSSLEEAAADMDLVIGTTARVRRGRYRYYSPVQLRDHLGSKEKSLGRVAILFGTETSGLSAAELELCHLISSIPTAEAQVSLNLAQAVMIYAYQLSSLSTLPGKRRAEKRKRGSDQEVFWQKLEQLLEVLEVDPAKPVYGRLKERLSLLPDDDIRLSHFLRKKILAKIKGRSRSL